MEFPSGCLGKLPLHGDFIRFNAAGAEINEFDHWIQEGIYQGYNELDSRWDSTFDAAPTARFIYTSPRTQRVIAGLFKPSVDKAGRRYPFLIYTVIEPGAMGAEIGYLPNAMGPFLTRARELLEWSESAINLSTFLSTFESLRFEPDMVEAKKEFARFVLTSNAGNYWSACFGSETDPRRYAAVGSTVEGAGTRAGSIAMRMPFSELDSEAAFWLELSRRLTDGKSLPTLVYWNVARGDFPARLNLTWGELSPRYFLPFVLPTRNSLNIRDLANANSVDGRWIEYGKARFDELLSNPSLKLTDLLQRLPRTRG
ncbi:MAG: type VI secretion system-associated protein TagF [Planctomycetes bacterium]|nr:type VI secretion system-associated protein TagF [Planctomycetota bacterium]